MKTTFQNLLLAFALAGVFASCSSDVSTGALPTPTPTQTVEVNGSEAITKNTKWTADKKYLLKGFVRVKSGATLTIEPGTIIMGDKTTTGSLIIERGAKLMAEGTAQRPIVFTSAQPAGSRNYGDWGGVVVLGNAPTNKPTTTIVEGIPDAPYGGTDPNDNSGVIKYVRIEFGGVAISPNNEINGLTLGGVGAGTKIEYVQVSYCGDDSFEMFGGTVNAKYLIAHRGWDDDFDTDFGYSGNVQYGLAIRNPEIADQSQSNGFESDNDNPATTSDPRTRATFSNMTILGPLDRGAAPNNLYGRAAHLRRNTRQAIFNSVLTGYRVGVHIDGSITQADALAGELEIMNTTLAAMEIPVGTYASSNGAVTVSAASQAIVDWFNTPAKNNTIVPNLAGIGYNSINMDSPTLLPPATSSLLGANAAAFTHPRVNNTFFDKVNFRGAFGTTDWTKGWANFNPQNTTY
jgi:hypothetical protein